MKKLNILFLGDKRHYLLEPNVGQEINWKKYKHTWHEALFREELDRQCNITHYGKDYSNDYDPNLSVKEIIDRFDTHFDIILTSYTDQKFNEFDDIKNILKVSIAGDVYNNAFRSQKNWYHYQSHSYDLLFGYSSLVTYWAKEWGYAKGFEILPFSVDINIYQKWNIPKKFDVMASFVSTRQKKSLVRHQIKRMVDKMSVRCWTKRAYYIDNVLKINQSKICINYLHQGFFNPRYFEILACGGFLLTDQPKYDLDLIGLKAGKHFATFTNLYDLKDKIIYWLSHDKERKRMARHGMRFVRKYHNTKIRVKQFIELVRRYL